MGFFDFMKLERPEYIERSRNEIFKEYSDKNEFWDPAGDPLENSSIKEENVKNHSKYLFIKENPEHIKKTFRRMYSFFWISFGIILIINILTFFLLLFPSIIILTLILMLPLGYSFYLKNLVKDMVKLEIALENKYLYWPEPNPGLWTKYKKSYPEIFQKGDKRQNLEDIFWGINEYHGMKNYFVSGLFNYTIVTRDKNGKKEHNYTDHFFIIKLPKKINSRFFLYPENIFSKIKNYFTNKKINTESISFNKAFAFSYKDKKNDKEMDITMILTPRVQEELLKMKEKKQGLSVLFSEDSVVFYAKGVLLRKIKTNFKKSPKINEEDKKIIKEELNKMVKVSCEIAKYLN
jgi:hypothetical protein